VSKGLDDLTYETLLQEIQNFQDDYGPEQIFDDDAYTILCQKYKKKLAEHFEEETRRIHEKELRYYENRWMKKCRN
jgi:hypothetical protein